MLDDDLPLPHQPSKGKNLLRIGARTAARMAAVQALFQMSQHGTSLSEVIRDFVVHRNATPVSEDKICGFEVEYFKELLGVAQEKTDELDAAITPHLSSEWRLERIDPVLRAILRCGACELFHFKEVPGKVTVSEYVALTTMFAHETEAKFVNALLDKLAKATRPAEFGG